jgi:hypothetical protein
MATLFYGPTILSGNYGDKSLKVSPTLNLNSVRRFGDSDLHFTGIADGEEVTLSQFYDAHGHNYNVYWFVKGELPAHRATSVELV